MNMNYHVEHHSTPMVPFHALPRLHEVIKAQTPPAYPSLWAVYKEMIPALYRQATQDPEYHIVRDLPAPTTPAQATASQVAPREPAHETAEAQWVDACAVDDLGEDDVLGFTHNGRVYAIYRLQGDRFYASDGLCTHGKAELAGGLVIHGCIECPKHNGRFDVATGKAVQHPATVDLHTYPAERRRNRVFIYMPQCEHPQAP